jgi:class 3 adenylate cyclase
MSATTINETILDEKLSQLERVRNWSPRVISKLETMIRTADDYSLFRINPIQFAAEKGISENEGIDLFLYGTKGGLFEMEWFLVCSSCGQVVESFRELTRLHSHFICNFCSAQNEAHLDDFIQIAFTVSSQVRDNMFRHPEQLSAEDYFLRYQRAKGISTIFFDRTFEEFNRDFTRLVSYIEPQQSVSVEFDALPGYLLVTDLLNNTGLKFMVSDSLSAETQPLITKLIDNKFQVTTQAVTQQELILGEFLYKFEQLGSLNSGKVVLDIENQTEKRSSVWAFNLPTSSAPAPLIFVPSLSGKRLLTTQTFRDLFRSEVVQTSEGIGVKDITFLFTDLKGSTALYDLIGDAKAYYLVRQHFDTLGKVIVNHSGAIVKTIGDAVMATFMNPVDAVAAAVEMLQEIQEFNRGISEQLILKIGVHRGHSIVVTLNDHLDYFGQTVNIAARIQGLADAEEIYISQDIYSAPGVAEALTACQVEAKQTAVKGVSGQLGVYKVTV